VIDTSSGNGLSGLWGEGGTERREEDVEVKEVLEEGRERREPQGVRNLREIHYVCVGGREFSIEMKRGIDCCRPSCQVRLQSTAPLPPPHVRLSHLRLLPTSPNPGRH